MLTRTAKHILGDQCRLGLKVYGLLDCVHNDVLSFVDSTPLLAALLNASGTVGTQ